MQPILRGHALDHRGWLEFRRALYLGPHRKQADRRAVRRKGIGKPPAKDRGMQFHLEGGGKRHEL